MGKLATYVLLAAAAFPIRFYVAVGVFRSFSIFDVVIALSLPLLLLRGMWRDGRVNVGDRLMFFLLAFPMVAALVSLAWTKDLGPSLRHTAASAEGVIAYTAMINAMDRLAAKEVFAAIVAFVLLLLLGSALFYLQVPGFERPVAPAELPEGSAEYVEWLTGFATRLGHPFIGQSNAFATVLAFFVPIMVAYARWADSRRARLAATLCTIAVLLTLSRGVAVALLLAMGVYVLLVSRTRARLQSARWFPYALGGAIVLAIPVAIALSNPEYAEVILESRLEYDSLAARLVTADAATHMIAQSPILGYGAAVAGYLEPALYGGAHDVFLEFFLAYGLPLGAMASFSVLLLPLAAARWRRVGADTQVLGAGLVAALAGQVMIYAVEASYESGPLRVLFGISLAMGIALMRAASKHNL